MNIFAQMVRRRFVGKNRSGAAKVKPAKHLLVERLEERTVPSISINEFALPNSTGSPAGIVAGPDGNLWFTEFNANAIGRMTPNGTVTEFRIPTAGAHPAGITVGPDGNLWFTEYSGEKIGRITTSGAITEFSTSPLADPYGIATGADGNLWFTEFNANAIGRITTSGMITQFALPTANVEPVGIAAGPNGNLWFTEEQSGTIGRITTNGTFLGTLTPPTLNSNPQGITAGPDGNVWFTEYAGNKIGRVTPSGSFTEFALSTPAALPVGIVAGSDGNLWFTESNGNKIGRISPSGAMAEFAVPTSFAAPTDIAIGPDGNLWFTEQNDGKIGQVDPPSGGQLTPDQHFVQALYNDFLKRSGSLAELNYWVSQLPSLGQTGVANRIIRSDEAYRRLVDTLYMQYLNRPADAAGEASWANILEHGSTEEQVITGFLGSSEYYDRATALGSSPSPDASFVQHLYQQLLGRTGSTQEIAGWVNQLPALGREGVAMDIVDSQEARTDAVFGFYMHLLNRTIAPSGAELSAWALAPLDILSIEVQFAGSQEFFVNG
jgi:streptogramin lyase